MTVENMALLWPGSRLHIVCSINTLHSLIPFKDAVIKLVAGPLYTYQMTRG